jgi:hypothetical protein
MRLLKWSHKFSKIIYWSTDNPRLIQKLPFHDSKVGVWYAVSVTRILEPIFFFDAGNSGT